MKQLYVIQTYLREIRNIAFPVRKSGIWHRLAGYLAKIINF